MSFSQNTMSVPNQLWVTPSKFDSKSEFIDIDFVVKRLTEVKNFAKQIESTLAALEQAYSKCSSEYSTQAPRLAQLSYNSSENAQLRPILTTHKTLSDFFDESARKFAKIRTDEAEPLRNSSNKAIVSLLADIAKLQTQLHDPFDQLVDGVKSYEKHFVKISRLTNPATIQTPLFPQQIDKVLLSQNTRLIKIQNHYIEFHLAFTKYCIARTKLFTDFDAFIQKTTSDYQKIIREMADVDSKIINDQQKAQVANDGDKQLIEDFWAEQPKEIPQAFQVTLNCPISTPEGKTLKPGDQFQLSNGDGDFWTIKADKNEYSVPAEAVVPYSK